MAKEPHGPVHLFRVLDEKLQSSDKAAAIELYYELLSSGHSVGEILSAVSPIRSEAERDDTAAAEHPRSGLDEAATDFTSEVAWVGAAQANALSTPGLSVPEDAEGCVTKKPAAADSASPDGLGSGGSQQLRRESLPGSEPDFVESPDVVEATGVHTATGREVALRSGDPERLQPNRFPSIAKRIAFGTLYTLAVASASIAGISIVRGGRDAEPMTSRLQSETSSGTETVAIPGSSTARAEAAAEPLKPTQQVVSSQAPDELQPSQSAEPHSAVSTLPQKLAGGTRVKVSAGKPEAEASQKSEVGQPYEITESNRVEAALPEPQHERTPEIAQPPSVARTVAPGAVVSNLAVLREALSTAPMQAAQTAYSTAPAKIHAGELTESAKPASAVVATVVSDPQIPDPAPALAVEAERRPEEPGHGVADAAILREAARGRLPELVLPPAGSTVATAPMPPATEATPEDQSIRNAEADALLARGDAFFATGDLTSARLFYEHAATAGNGAAALRLGGTFDPAFLVRARVGRGQGDLLTALYWYRRARELGNRDAEVLLRSMGNTTR